jgi:hypothetical protein
MRLAAFANHFRMSKCCEVHKAFAVSRAQFGVWGQLVSSMIAFAISQRPAGSLDTLRMCAVEFFIARLDFIPHVLPPRQCSEHRAVLFPWLLHLNGPEANRRRSTIETFLNGDWSNPTPQHYHAWNCTCGCESVSDARRFVEDHLVPSLMPAMTRLFPRHRWTRAEQTISDTLLMCAPHQLLLQILPVWLQCLRQRRNPTVKD